MARTVILPSAPVTASITPEEQARFEEFTREINARIAERRARERDAPGPSGR
jgi:hypothetical protein